MRCISTGLVLQTLFYLSAHEEVSSRKIGRSSETLCDNDFYDAMWTATGEVPDKFPDLPPSCLDITYNGNLIMPNYKVPTEKMLEKPVLGWNTEEGSLYTIFILDYGIERLGGLQYYHWIMANVVDEFGFDTGDEVQEYIPPFGYEVNEDGTDLDYTEGTPLHDILVMVYKQKNGLVDMADERQSGCDSSIVDNRIGDHAAVAKKYNLELVAGNFFFTTYNEATNDLLCYFTKCTGEPFPIPVPGINDGPDCQTEELTTAGAGAGCQQPGNALCYLSDYGITIGEPCCSGSLCMPWFGEFDKAVDNFCQYSNPVEEGGFCGNKVGQCADGLSCLNNMCSKVTTTTTAAGTTQCDNDFYNAMWKATGEVPGKIPDLPASCLDMTYNGKLIMPNYQVPTEEMLEKPVLGWNTEEGALYTIFILDYGIERLGGLQYYHWIMANVVDEFGLDIGDEVQEYIPPFGYEVNEDGTDLDYTEGTPRHDILVLVYKQKSGNVNMADERQSGCDSSIVDNRIGDHASIAEKYNLGLVAGTFFFTTYNEATNDLLCYFTKCTGEPFPIPVPGINDGPDCQAEVDSICQQPGNALCKVPGVDIDFAPCCDGSECKVWYELERVNNWYCQSTSPIPAGGSCGSKEGACAAGTACTDGVCTGTCLPIGTHCYENLVYIGSCCDNVCMDCDATTFVCKCKKT